MVFIWDYDKKELNRTEAGRILILERQINNGVYRNDKEKIPLEDVKKYWDKLNIEPRRRHFLQFLLWKT